LLFRHDQSPPIRVIGALPRNLTMIERESFPVYNHYSIYQLASTEAE
jgi:hypothetical protein